MQPFGTGEFLGRKALLLIAGNFLLNFLRYPLGLIALAAEQLEPEVIPIKQPGGKL